MALVQQASRPIAVSIPLVKQCISCGDAVFVSGQRGDRQQVRLGVHIVRNVGNHYHLVSLGPVSCCGGELRRKFSGFTYFDHAVGCDFEGMW